MADTIARLIFEANTAQLKKANAELKKLAQESGKAAKSVNDGTKAKKKSGDETKKLTEKERLLAESLKKTGNETKKTTTATDKMTESLKRASNAAAVMTGPLGGVSGRLSFLATGMNKFGLAGIATGVALAGVATIAKASLANFAAYETQMLKLEAITKATGHAAGFTAKELDAMAMQIGRDTLASASGIRDVQGILLSFGNITGDVFERAINASVDLSAVMGVTAASSAKTLAKALEDPIGNLSAMTRAGITFTEVEKEKIKALAENNKLLEAQDIILGKIEGKLKGAGEGGGLAAATDLLGENITNASIQIAKAAGLAESATTIVGGLASIFRGIEDFADAMTPSGKEEYKELGEELTTLQVRYAALMAVGGGKDLADSLFGEKIAEKIQLMNEMRDAAFAGSKASSLAIESRREGPEEEDEFNVPDAPSTVGTKDDPMMKILGPLVQKYEKEKALAEEADAKEKERQVKKDAAEEARTKIKAAKEEEDRQASLAANQLKGETELAQNAQFILESQNRLQEAALFERDFKLQLAQEELDRQILSNEFDNEMAVSLHLAKLERIQAEYDEELLVIIENEQRAIRQKEKERNKDIKLAAKSGDIKAKGALKLAKYEEMTSAKKASTILGDIQGITAGSAKESRTMFEINKAASIGSAIMNTYEGVNESLSAYPMPWAAGVAAIHLAAGLANVNAIKSQTFGGGSASGGKTGSGAGGAVAAVAAARDAPIQDAANDEPETAAPSVVNVTVDGTIDPSGARRIIEAINEATEDGLEINALVGT
tara:strand:+ start:2274 stop:4616 length:2343 start_codon:yes stop_codon:yes gene_type:complete